MIKIFIEAWKYLLAGLIMLIVLVIENQYLSPSVIHTMLMVLSGSITYFTVLLILKDEFVQGYIKKILHK